MPLSLRVFEPRYRQLVTECLQANEPFGVVLIREGPEVGGSAIPHDVGTTARITSATTGQDGVIDLQTVGARRFRIRRLYDDRPYLYADVDYLDDFDASVAPDIPDMVQRARAGLQRIAQLQAVSRGEFERVPAVPATPASLADAIAAFAVPDPRMRQELLETLDVATRLERVLPLLDAAIEVIGARSAEAVATRWGGFGMAN